MLRLLLVPSWQSQHVRIILLCQWFVDFALKSHQEKGIFTILVGGAKIWGKIFKPTVLDAVTCGFFCLILCSSWLTYMSSNLFIFIIKYLKEILNALSLSPSLLVRPSGTLY